MILALCLPAAQPPEPLNLAQIYQQAQAASPGIKGAIQKLAEAEAKVRENALLSRPGLVLGANSSISRGILPSPQETKDFYTYQGLLTLNVPNGAKTSAASRAAGVQFRIAQLDLRRMQLDLAMQAETAYFTVLQFRDAVAIAQTNLVQAKLQVEDTKKRVAAGDVPEADELKAAVPELQAEAAQAASQSQFIEAKQGLNSLLGKPLNENVGVADMAGNYPAYLSSISGEQLDDDSPEIQEAKAGVESAEAALQLARRGNDPQFSLQATATHTSDPTTWMNLGSVGLSLTVPIFDNGVLKQQVKEAQLEVDQANSTLLGARRAAMLQAQSALADVKAAEIANQMDQKILVIAEESSRKAVQSYEAGLTTTRDVLDAQITAAAARNDANNARYNLALAIAKLRRVYGEVGF